MTPSSFRRGNPIPLQALAIVLALLVAWMALAQDTAQPRGKSDTKKADPDPKAKAKAKEKDADRSGTLRPADLKLEAEQTREPAIREMYLRLAVVHDLVHWKDDKPAMRVEPVYRYVDADTDFKERLKLVPPRVKGKAGIASYATRAEIKRIEPYEEIALGEIKRFLDPAGPTKGIARLLVLQAAERALLAVARFHASARGDGSREGVAWDAVGRKLHERLLRTQIEALAALAQADDWDRAYDLSERLTRVHKEPEIRARVAEPMSLFIAASLKAEKYAEVYERLKLLQDIFPGDALPAPVNKSLAAKAAELFERAKREKDQAKKVALLTLAENLWPRLPGLRDYRLKMSDTYPILYVGVAALPRNLSPAAACTDPERWAVELLFESLVRPTYRPDVGERYEAVLASRPALIPLGREFNLDRDAYWSDGKPVTGSDVRQTVRLLTQRGGAGLLKEARLGGDSYHVQLLLGQGFIDPLALMSFKVLPESARLERPDDESFARQPVGSGPYVFQKRDAEAAIFAANPYYRRPGKLLLPIIREVRFLHSKDPGTDINLGRLHLVLDPQAVMKVQENSHVKVHALPNRRIYFLAVNHRKDVLRNEELRRGLAFAIDRTKILDEAFRKGWKGEGNVPHRPLHGPYPPDSWACKKELKTELSNPMRAKALIGKHKERARSARLTLKYPSGDDRVVRACEMLRAQIGDAGLEIRLEPRTPEQLRKDVEIDHDYDLAYYHWDYANEAYLLWPMFDRNAVGRGGSNFLGYEPNSGLQSLFRKALDHREFRAVQRLTHDIQGLLNEEMPLIPLWQLDTLLAVHEKVATVPQPQWLDPLLIFPDIERWKIK